MELFPSRPLELDVVMLKTEGRKKLLAAVLSVIVGMSILAYAGMLGKELWQERALWDRGIAGTVTSISGDVTKTIQIIPDYSYKLQVSYRDTDGKPHRGTAKFGYIIQELAKDEDVELRYDPRSPDEFVLSWQAQGGLRRSGMFVLFALTGLGFVASAPLSARKNKKRKNLLHQVALARQEHWLEMVKLEKQYGIFILTYLQTSPDSRNPKKKRESLPVAPLIVTRDGKNHVIALSSTCAPLPLYFIPEDLGPFIFTDEERTAIALKLAACRSANFSQSVSTAAA